MKKPFQVGERVSGDWPWGKGYKRVRGVFDGYDSESGEAIVDRYMCAPNSLKRLRPKKRRRIYVNPEIIRRVDLAFTAISDAGIDTSGKLGKARGWLEFVEVKREP